MGITGRPAQPAAGRCLALAPRRKAAARERPASKRSPALGRAFGCALPMKTISARLGHSTIVLTANTCGHPFGGVDQEAAERFDTALRAAMPAARAECKGAGEVPAQGD